jgi:hypothetical protein
LEGNYLVLFLVKSWPESPLNNIEIGSLVREDHGDVFVAVIVGVRRLKRRLLCADVAQTVKLDYLKYLFD